MASLSQSSLTHSPSTTAEDLGTPNSLEDLAADLEALCEAGLIEASADHFGRVRYGLKAQA